MHCCLLMNVGSGLCPCNFAVLCYKYEAQHGVNCITIGNTNAYITKTGTVLMR